MTSLRPIAKRQGSKPRRDDPGREPAPVTLYDQEAASRLSSLLCTAPTSRLTLTYAGTKSLDLPEAFVRVLAASAEIVARGERVTVLADAEALTTQAAADLLNVSRQYLVRLIDRGDLPASKTGSHRRIRAGDLQAFQARRARDRAEALDQIVTQAEADGGYDQPMGFGPPRR